MPPKAKKGGPVIIDGVDTSQMTREKLEVFALRLKEECDREREERNFFQMERDKLRTFWEINRNELEEARTKLRNKDRQIEEATEKNEEELKFYRQKVKHIQYEHLHDLTQIKTEQLVSLKTAQEDHDAQEMELLKDKQALKAKLREQEFDHQEQIRGLKVQHSEEIHNVQKEFEEKAKELENKYDKKYAELKRDLTIKFNMEIAETEERKNTQINELTQFHEQAFNDMKNYYNDITLNNLALISSLKDQMEALRKQNQRMAKQVADLTAENKKLVEPLKQAKEEVAEYKKKLENYEKDKISLANTKIKLAQTQKDLDSLTWIHDTLQLRFDKIEAEKEMLTKRFTDAILEVQEKTGLKNVLLQKRIEKLTESTELQDAILGELKITASKAPGRTNQQLENILAKKNAIIHDLQYEIARVTKAHDDLLNTYEEKLLKFGIPKAELGFTPLKIVPEGQATISKGPAGLVTKNR